MKKTHITMNGHNKAFCGRPANEAFACTLAHFVVMKSSPVLFKQAFPTKGYCKTCCKILDNELGSSV